MTSGQNADDTNSRFLSLPRIQVSNLSDEDDVNDTTPSPSPMSDSGLSGSLSSHLPEFRDRSMSGSTVATSGSDLELPASDTLKPASSTRSASSWMGEADPLRAEPGSEADFVVNDNRFAFSPGQLNKLLNPKSPAAYASLGGIRGLEQGLRTSLQAGLSRDETNLHGTISFEEATRASYQDGTVESVQRSSSSSAATATSTHASSEAFADRRRTFRRNVLPEKKTTPLWKLVWRAYLDKVLLLLTAAAIISLALGLYETFGIEHDPREPMPIDWVEGLAICIAIVIVVLVGSLNDYQKERAFAKLNAKKDDREVKVIRSGKPVVISVHDVLVGDVLHIEAGDLICADGIFIDGHNVKCDESSATGESDQLKKTGGDEVMRLLREGHKDEKDMDPFIISGSKVLEGVGTYLVTSVGVNSSYGKILMAMRQETDETPLQIKLDALASAIAKLGASAAALLFVVLLIRFGAKLPSNPLSGAEKASQFTDILIVSITVIVVAVPEGLPLAVTLALAFATTRLVKLNNLVRVLKSCETMGNATTICSDKTGTLTQNKMTVVTGTFGSRSFDDKNVGQEQSSTAFATTLSHEEKRLIIEAAAINSTAFESEENGTPTFVGSKTETALLTFARNALGMGPLSEERSNAEVVQLMPFDSSRKCMGAVQKLPGGIHRFLLKGASEVLLRYCSVDQAERERLEMVIECYANQSLRTIALVYRDFAQWPPVGAVSKQNHTLADLGALLHNMNFLGVVGIQDPIRPGVPEAVKNCQRAGVTVRMVTGDNLVTAKAIAADCGIYTGGTIMEGPTFRILNDEEMRDVLPQLQVLARSSPEDKRILVSKLRELGEIVAVTGDGTNDGPALKAADIGFSMGLSGTEVAKEASQIVLMDDNFASILTALMWGRAVNDAVRKFLQFQITVNITAVILTFVSAVSNPNMKSVLTAVQLLWINLIMDSLAALALATDPPTEEILDRKPAKRDAPLISTTMWKMIVGQATFQLAVTFTLYYAGPEIFNVHPDDSGLRSMVFNTFVWMQIFNEFNNRRLDNKFNIFQGIQRNYFFILINIGMVAAQIVIAFFGGKAFSIIPINGWQWAVCLVLAVVSLPWAVAIRVFPDVWFGAAARVVGSPFVLVHRSANRLISRIGGRLRRLGRRNKSQAEALEIAVIPGSQMHDVEKHGN